MAQVPLRYNHVYHRQLMHIPWAAQMRSCFVSHQSMPPFTRVLKLHSPTLVAQIKPNMFNIWPKINTLISSLHLFKGGLGGLP